MFVAAPAKAWLFDRQGPFIGVHRLSAAATAGRSGGCSCRTICRSASGSLSLSVSNGHRMRENDPDPDSDPDPEAIRCLSPPDRTGSIHEPVHRLSAAATAGRLFLPDNLSIGVGVAIAIGIASPQERYSALHAPRSMLDRVPRKAEKMASQIRRPRHRQDPVASCIIAT